MFGGDETGAIVVDTGSYSSKFGYGGDDAPKSVFLTSVGVQFEPSEDGKSRAGAAKRYIAGPAARLFRPHVELKQPFDYSLVDDWDAMECIWDHGFRELRAKPADRPILLSEPPFTLPSQREKTLELMFERFNAPAVFLAKTAMLAATSVGRAAAIVVDVGASCSRVTPVYDGYVMTKSMYMSEVGGQFLTRALADSIGAEMLPHYAFKRTLAADPRAPPTASSAAATSASAEDVVMSSGEGGPAPATAPASVAATSSSSTRQREQVYTTGGGKWRVQRCDISGVTSSFHQASVVEVVDDAKRAVCVVDEIGFDPARAPAPATYELPDGTVVEVGNARSALCELHFRADPHADERCKRLLTGLQTAGFAMHKNHGVQVRNDAAPHTPIPLHLMVYNALLHCNPEVRRDIASQIVLTGGGSLLRGLHTRLHWELQAHVPAAFKPRLVVAAPLEREYAAWIGGSILSSLGTFQQMWVSRAEYDEHGSGVVDSKCL